MAGSSNQYGYGLGSTLMNIPNGAPVKVTPPAYCNGVYISWASGGTLVIAPNAGLTQGPVVMATERVYVEGPAAFYLCSNGSTAVAGIIFKFSSGISTLP